MKRACLIVVVMVILAGTCFAQSPHQVEVVAVVSLTNQTGTTGQTLYTPQETGMFRVNFYVQCTKGSKEGGGLEPVFYWTDDNHREVADLQTIPDLQPGQPESFVFIFKALAGKPIAWSVFLNRNDTSEYEVYLALERIGPKVQ